MLLLGFSGKLAVSALFSNPFPPSGYEANWQSVFDTQLRAQADLFAFGMAIAAMHVQVVRGAIRLPRWWRAAAIAAALCWERWRRCRLADVDGHLGYPIENTLIAAGRRAPARAGRHARPRWRPSRPAASLEAPAAVGSD